MHSGQSPAIRHGFAWSAGALLFYVALAVALFANVWSSPATRWIGLGGDPETTAWSLAWAAYSLVHGLNPFVTHQVFFPDTTSVLWANADAPIVLGWLVAPITMTLGPLVAYNVLQTLALALSAFAAYLACRRFVARPGAAIAGGLVYGFGPYAMGQAYGHMALAFTITPPLLLVVIHRLLVSRDLGPVLAGVLAGVLEAFQLLVSEELVATTAIVAAAALIALALIALTWRIAVPWRETLRRAALSGAVALAVFVVLAAYPIYTLFRGPARITHEPIRGFGSYVTDVANLVIPVGRTQLIHNDWTVAMSASFPGAPVESGGYLGVALIGILVFTTLRWWRDPSVAFAAVMLAITTLISFGPRLVYAGHLSAHVVLPWELARNVPVLNEVLVERFGLYTDLFAGILLAIFIDRAWSSRLSVSRPAAMAATAVALALLVPFIPWSATPAQIPSAFQQATPANRDLHAMVPDGSVLVILPANAMPPGYGYSMLWQAADGMRFTTVDGDLVHGDASGHATFDPAPSPLWAVMSDLQHGRSPTADADAVRAELSSLGVKAIVVGPMAGQDAAIQYIDQLLGRAPRQIGGVYVWTVG